MTCRHSRGSDRLNKSQNMVGNTIFDYYSMSTKLKAYVKQFEDNAKKAAKSDVQEFCKEFDSWIASYKGEKAKWSLLSQKPLAIKCMDIFHKVSMDILEESPVFLHNFYPIVLKLIFPQNDPEIRKKALYSSIFLINITIDHFNFHIWDEFFLTLTALNKSDADAIKIGDPSPLNQEEIMEYYHIICENMNTKSKSSSMKWLSIVSYSFGPIMISSNTTFIHKEDLAEIIFQCFKDKMMPYIVIGDILYDEVSGRFNGVILPALVSAAIEISTKCEKTITQKQKRLYNFISFVFDCSLCQYKVSQTDIYNVFASLYSELSNKEVLFSYFLANPDDMLISVIKMITELCPQYILSLLSSCIGFLHVLLHQAITSSTRSQDHYYILMKHMILCRFLYYSFVGIPSKNLSLNEILFTIFSSSTSESLANDFCLFLFVLYDQHQICNQSLIPIIDKVCELASSFNITNLISRVVVIFSSILSSVLYQSISPSSPISSDIDRNPILYVFDVIKPSVFDNLPTFETKTSPFYFLNIQPNNMNDKEAIVFIEEFFTLFSNKFKGLLRFSFTQTWHCLTSKHFIPQAAKYLTDFFVPSMIRDLFTLKDYDIQFLLDISSEIINTESVFQSLSKKIQEQWFMFLICGLLNSSEIPEYICYLEASSRFSLLGNKLSFTILPFLPIRLCMLPIDYRFIKPMYRICNPAVMMRKVEGKFHKISGYAPDFCEPLFSSGFSSAQYTYKSYLQLLYYTNNNSCELCYKEDTECSVYLLLYDFLIRETDSSCSALISMFFDTISGASELCFQLLESIHEYYIEFFSKFPKLFHNMVNSLIHIIRKGNLSDLCFKYIIHFIIHLLMKMDSNNPSYPLCMGILDYDFVKSSQKKIRDFAVDYYSFFVDNAHNCGPIENNNPDYSIQSSSRCVLVRNDNEETTFVLSSAFGNKKYTLHFGKSFGSPPDTLITSTLLPNGYKNVDVSFQQAQMLYSSSWRKQSQCFIAFMSSEQDEINQSLSNCWNKVSYPFSSFVKSLGSANKGGYVCWNCLRSSFCAYIIPLLAPKEREMYVTSQRIGIFWVENTRIDIAKHEFMNGFALVIIIYPIRNGFNLVKTHRNMNISFGPIRDSLIIHNSLLPHALKWTVITAYESILNQGNVNRSRPSDAEN